VAPILSARVGAHEAAARGSERFRSVPRQPELRFRPQLQTGALTATCALFFKNETPPSLVAKRNTLVVRIQIYQWLAKRVEPLPDLLL
jgi:hypothetical protein